MIFKITSNQQFISEKINMSPLYSKWPMAIIFHPLLFHIVIIRVIVDIGGNFVSEIHIFLKTRLTNVIQRKCLIIIIMHTYIFNC